LHQIAKCAVLALADGAHDRAQIVERIIELVNDGQLTVEGARSDRAELNEVVDSALARLASGALLEA